MFEKNLTFVAADPPRTSWFGCWESAAPGGLFSTSDADTVDLELVLPAKRGSQRVSVAAHKLELAGVIDSLAALSKDDAASESAHVWAVAMRTALAFIAEGKVLPWLSPQKYDSWRVDPLDQQDLTYVQHLAKALPVEAHATVVKNQNTRSKQLFMSDPTHCLRSFFDAVADCFIRTSAASDASGLTLFADRQPTKAPQLRPWLNDLAVAHCASSQLILRVHPPEEDAAQWLVTFHLQSKLDPSLVIDVSNFWQTPAKVMQRLGEQAEITLLAGLRRLADLVSPFKNVLQQTNPTEAWLDDDELDILLDQLEALNNIDIDVRWPSELVAPKIERQLVVTSGPPESGLPSMTGLKALLEVNWEFLLEGSPLKPDELKILGRAKRSVVQLRGKWVRIDRSFAERLRQRPPELHPVVALTAALGSSIDLEDEDGDFAIRTDDRVAAIAQQLLELSNAREQSEPPGLQAVLRPYQRRGLAWMADLCSLGMGGCLADDMGLGKTIQVLSLHALRGGSTLVVCPTSLLHNWAREAAKFVPDVSVRIYHGPNRTLDNIQEGELVITTYGVVRSDNEAIKEQLWDLCVADEAQHAKNPFSRTAKSLRQLQSNARIALTGTPVENRLSELWSILDWAVPGLLGPLETFRRRTALPIEKDNDTKASAELQQLTKPFLLRRKKTDPGIAPELPPKIERDVVVPLSPEQVTLYKATVDSALTEVAQTDGIKRRGLVLKLLTGLKQITNHPAQYLGQSAPLAGRSGKIDALLTLLETARQSEESTLIFTQYVKMGELLTSHLDEAGYKVEMLHGGQSVKSRQQLVDQFQNKQIDVLILSLKAGGTGLNLTAASNVIHYDRWWNPAVEDQATDRAYRIGQKQTVTVHRIVTQGTVEDRVAELLRVKRQLADKAIGGGEAWLGDLSDDDLGELVALEEAA